jgi:hypothetical protein
MFENCTLKKHLDGMNEPTGRCRKLYNKGLNDEYCLPCVIRAVKSLMMGFEWHTEQMGEKRNSWENQKETPLGR